MTHNQQGDIVADMMRKAVEANLDEDDNLDAVHEDFNQLVEEAFGSGHVIVTGGELKRMTSDYHWTRLNSKAGRATQSHMKQIADGVLTMFELDAVLDQVVTAGKNRRTTIRHMNKRDLARMTEERRRNYDKQRIAWDDWENNIDPRFDGWLSRYGNIPAAVSAGAVQTAQPNKTGTTGV